MSRSARSAEASASPSPGMRAGAGEQPLVGADLGDPVQFGCTAAQQHQPVGVALEPLRTRKR